MPAITTSHTIEITPERFVKACSDLELFELDRLLGTAPIQARLRRMATGSAEEPAKLLNKPENNK